MTFSLLTSWNPSLRTTCNQPSFGYRGLSRCTLRERIITFRVINVADNWERYSCARGSRVARACEQKPTNCVKWLTISVLGARVEKHKQGVGINRISDRGVTEDRRSFRYFTFDATKKQNLLCTIVTSVQPVSICKNSTREARIYSNTFPVPANWRAQLQPWTFYNTNRAIIAEAHSTKIKRGPNERTNERTDGRTSHPLAAAKKKKRTNLRKEKQIQKKKKKRKKRKKKKRKNRVGSRQQTAVTGTRNYCEPSQWHAVQHARYHSARGRMTMFSGSGGEFLSVKQVNSGFANSLTTDGYAARGNDSASS